MRSPPPVSICLLTYNRAHLISKTLDSILDQSFSDFELIISDDFSNDNTEEICLEYCKSDDRIIYVRNKSNLGMPGNLNASLQAARGEYVANLHDGDVYRQDLIVEWKSCLDEFPTAGFVFNAYKVLHDDGRQQTFSESYPPLISGLTIVERLLSQWSSCVFGTVMARKSIYEHLGWFDPKFGNFSDIDMWIRIAKELDVGYVNKPLMDLMPKDPSRFYSFVHWKVVFWILGIHVTNINRCRSVLPSVVKTLSQAYPHRRRNYLSSQMLLCIKHRRWDRVREGLAIWRNSDDRLLKLFGLVFGESKFVPDWYEKCYWNAVSIS